MNRDNNTSGLRRAAEINDHLALAERVLKQVTEEFKTWAIEDTAKTFARIESRDVTKKGANVEAPQDTFSLSELSQSLEQGNSSPPTPVDSSRMGGKQIGTSKATVWNVLAGSTTTLEFPTFTCEETAPVPEYESWIPLKGSVWRDPGFDELKFVPYADDPEFPAEEYQDVFFSYQGLRDVDREKAYDDVIELEAALRLIYDHGLSSQEVDDTRVLRLSVLDDEGSDDLLSLLTSRDFPEWPGLSRHLFPNFQALSRVTELRTNLRARVERLVSVFCPVLSCSHYLCPQHSTLISRVRTKERTSYSSKRGLASSSCGMNCVNKLGIGNITPSGIKQWTNQQKQDLKDILSLTDDITSCDLATMLEKRCDEVFYWMVATGFRKDFFKEKPRARTGQKRFADLGDPQTFDYWDACQHEGECHRNSSCVCFTRDLHCTRGCSCSLNCGRKFKGCTCTVNGRPDLCRTNKFVELGMFLFKSLMIALIEEFSDRSSEPTDCANCVLQLRKWKKIIVKPSEYGWGAFIGEDVSEGEFISEYIGEIIDEPQAMLRGIVSDYSRRNYRFELNHAWTVDASVEGNESRFINHSTTRANAKAEIKIYDSDHAIAIYASRDLKAGEEIFLNYGPDYFQEHVPAISAMVTDPNQ